MKKGDRANYFISGVLIGTGIGFWALLLLQILINQQ